MHYTRKLKFDPRFRCDSMITIGDDIYQLYYMHESHERLVHKLLSRPSSVSVGFLRSIPALHQLAEAPYIRAFAAQDEAFGTALELALAEAKPTAPKDPYYYSRVRSSMEAMGCRCKSKGQNK